MPITLTPNAVSHTLRCLMRTAAPALSFQVHTEGDRPAIRLDNGLSISFSRIPESDWPSLLDGSYPMGHIPSFDGGVSVPVLLAEGTPFAVWEGDTLCVHADLLTLSFLLLSRAEEVLLPERDTYGRFLWKYSLAAKYGWIDLPVVDEWALLLRQALSQRLTVSALGGNRPSLRPTHDMDTARRFPSVFAAARTILGGDLLRLKSPRIAAESLRQYVRSRTHPERDPELLGAEALLSLSQRLGFVSEFYFMGVSQGEDDIRYEVSAPAVRGFAEKVKTAGMVCGFHASRLTPEDGKRFRIEQQRVSAALESPACCGRQHYLCFHAEKTPLIWQDAGVRYDDTLGYADHEGFRCGTCHAYPLYDLEHDRPLEVVERPLLVMDGTLKEYRGLTRPEALERLKALFTRCCAVEGDFVILWHNGCVFRDWTPWFREVYVPFMEWAAGRLGKDETHCDE